MFMDRQDRINSEVNYVGNTLHINFLVAGSTYQMKPSDQNIIAVSAAADAAAILVLPSIAEACGKFYCIVAPTGAAGGDISLYEKETGAELTTYGDMDADDDWAILYSDGRKWRNVAIVGVA
jgi:hypothetical protein